MSNEPDPKALKALEPLTAIELIYGRCRPEALLLFGSRQPHPSKPDFPQPMFAIQAADRHNWLPAIFAHMVDQTQYIKPSTYTLAALVEGNVERYRQAIQRGRPLYYAALLSTMDELVALVVDLDVGRDPKDLDMTLPENRSKTMTTGQALGAVIDRVQAGSLPPPSLTAYSGRGVYLWWLLTAADGRPPLNTTDNDAQRRLIAGELVNRTRDLAADQPAAKNANQWFKRPGTIVKYDGQQPIDRNRVTYHTWGLGHPNAVPRYRLPELMGRLDLHHAPAVPPPAKRGQQQASLPPWPVPDPRSTTDARRTPSAATRAAAPQRCRVEEIERLAVHRNGIREGAREVASWHYYHARRMFLFKTRRAGDEREAVNQAQHDTRRFNDAYCRPPLEPGELDGVFNRLSGQAYKATGPTVSAALRVTRDEAERLRLVALAPPDLRRERRQEQEQAKAEKDARQARIDALLRNGVSAHEVARQTGTPRSTVRSRKKRLAARGQLPDQRRPQERLEIQNDDES